MDYKRTVLQMLKRLQSVEAWKAVYTLVKVLLEQRGD